MKSLISIRQTADTATTILEILGSSVNPLITTAVKAHFRADEESHGNLGVEFLQGFYSGMLFAQSWLISVEGSKAASTQLVSQLTIEAARKYIEQIERMASES